MPLQAQTAEKLAERLRSHPSFEAKHKQSGHDQADEPISACLSFPQRRLRVAVTAVHRLEVTMHAAFGKFGPQSHSGGPCSEGWLKSCLKSALQSTRSTTHCPALEIWPIYGKADIL